MSRIQIGANDSPQLRNMLKESLIDVDWIKLSDELMYEEQVKTNFPKKKALIHFFPRITCKELPLDWSIEKFNSALRTAQSPHLGIHLRAARSDFEKVPHPEEMIKFLTGKLKHLKESLCVPILLENMPSSCLPDGYKYMADPNWIHHLCQEAKVGLLLDIAHARMSAHEFGESIGTYLGKLPLSKMEEIHISGIRKSAGKWVDAHEGLEPVDLEILEVVLGQKTPKMITVEYDHRGKHYEENQIKIRLFNALFEVDQVIEKSKVPVFLIR